MSADVVKLPTRQRRGPEPDAVADATPFWVARHPYRPGWTHLIAPRDCRRRGWGFIGFDDPIPFGRWPTRRAAVSAGLRIQRESRTFRMVQIGRRR